uniref:Transposase IS200-like domain-containing protein n=1 Tax=wastewater metagenome TaxID=527639 RepID=A0A0A8KXN4_9ZZZZ
MGKPLRNTDPTVIRIITLRTSQAQLLMRPDSYVNETISGILAKYQEQFNITIYTHTFNSNHYHLLVQAPEQNLHLFEENVNREISKRINWHIDRKGSLWQRRYDDLSCLDQDDILRAFLYVTCNPVSHGLVDHPKHWPGVNAYWQIINEKDCVCYFTNYTEYNKAKRKAQAQGKSVCINDYKSEHILKLTPLPQFKDLTPKERKATLFSLIEKHVASIQKDRKERNLGFLGRQAILEQSPFDFPKNTKTSKRPLCYTNNQVMWHEYRKQRKLWEAAYRIASALFRQGEYNKAEFPLFSIKPPAHHIPL